MNVGGGGWVRSGWQGVPLQVGIVKLRSGWGLGLGVEVGLGWGWRESGSWSKS